MTATISGIILENFRSFSEPTKVDLRPITFLYGQNSAGKSSIIKALLLLQQSLTPSRRRGADFNSFVFAGESVDLGSFSATVSGHNQNNVMRVGVETTSNRLVNDVVQFNTITWSSNEGVNHQSMSVEFAIRGHNLHFERHPSRPKWLLTKSSVASFLELITSNATLFTHDNDMVQNLSSNLGYLPEFIGDRFPRTLQSHLVPPGARNQWLTSGNFSGRSPSNDPEELEPQFGDNQLAKAWRDVSAEHWDQTRIQLHRLAHIGPLRQEPVRFDRYTPTSGTEVGSSGNEMLSLLYEKPRLVTQVNDYLDMMELPYKIKIVSLGSPETVGKLIYLVLVNRLTGLELSPSDVGVGYSQVLPLIAQSTLARNQLVCVEQPELHLHPAMQARLGDLFISEAVGGSQTRFLIETHSESLMLRILRRIREGTLRPEDVQVIYVDQGPGGNSIIKDIPIDANGDFVAEWPTGFFDERLEELGF